MALAKPWLAHYEKGVPAEIDPSVYGSLVDLLDESFRKFASRDMLAFMEARMSFAQVDELSRAFAAWMQAQGLQKGARVALMMPNIPQYAVGIAAVLRAGCTVVNVNPLYTPRELEHQLNDSGADAIVILENFAVTLQEVLPRTKVKHVIVASMGDLLPFLKGALVNFVVRHVKKMVPAFNLSAAGGRQITTFKAVLAAGRSAKYTRPDVKASDVAFLQYTGGTTGVSKGATLLHSNVVANILQCEAWFMPEVLKLGSQSLTQICALPLYHIFSLTVCYFMGARMGTMNVLIANPRDIPGFIKTLQNYKVNMFPAVNTLFNGLANYPDFAKLDFSGLKVCMGGGMAVQQSTAEKWRKITGCAIAEGYGLSETSPVATANRLDITEFNGAIGYPLPSTEVAILDDDGNVLAIGEVGEIAIRGPQVMAGYWQRPDETAKVMTADGFFRTGDIGVMDETGLTKIVDRKKDMILVSGFNVYPNEIEDVVTQMPGILECAAVGDPDPHSGEVVRLVIVREDPQVTEQQVRDYCAQHLTGYKRPKVVEFRAELPKTPVGKILRRELRKAA